MLRKYATLQTLEAFQVPAHATGRTLRKAAHRVGFDYTPRPGYLYVRSRAISSRCNDNYDEFPAAEIKTAYRSFVGKPVFVNHHNDDHKRARGVIIDAALHEDRNPDGSPDTWAEVLMEVDAVKFPKLAKAILAGEVDRTSMGCDVQLSVCSACGNKATNPAEYCHHIPAMKGQRIFRVNASTGRREGHLVREICHGLKFFENSLLVEEPADPTAYFLGVDDRGMKATVNAKKAVATSWYHGTRAELRPGDMVYPGETQANYSGHGRNRLEHSYFSSDMDEAQAYARNARSEGMQRVYEVQPTGEYEPDEPRGHPDYRSPHPLKVVREVWHDPAWDSDPRPWYEQKQGRRKELTVESSLQIQASLGNMSYSPLSEDGFELDRLQSEAAAGPKYPDPADHPFFKEHPSSPDNIVKAWGEANDGQKAQGKRWYADAHEIASAIAGGDAAKGAGVLAAYSPKAAWPSNMFNAARSLKEGRALGKGEGDSIMGMHQRLAQKMIGDGDHPAEHHSKVLKSPKISDFAHLIEHGGDDDPDHHTRVVVDRHAMSVATGQRMTTKDLEDAPLGSRHYYEHVANHFRMAAAAVSEHEGERVYPHQVQAVTWLVQQHKNIAHDLSMPGPGGKGRQTRDKNVWNRWSEERHHHAPDLKPENIHIQNPHAPKGPTLASRKGYEDFEDVGMNKQATLDQVKAPPEVDTLRDEECPVCGDAEVFDGERCPICGFIAPPSMFRDPDLEVAKQMDLRGDQVQPGSELPGGGGLVDPEQLAAGGTGDAAADQLQHPDQLNPNGEVAEPGTPGDGVPDLFCPACGEGVDAGQPMSQVAGDPNATPAAGPEEGMPCPNCGMATLLSSGDMQQMDQMGEMAGPEAEGAPISPDELPEGEEQPEEGTEEEDPNADPNAPPQEQDGAEEPPPDDDGDDDDDDTAVDEDDPAAKKRDKNSKGASMNKAVEATVKAQAGVIDSLRRENFILNTKLAFLAKVAGVEEQFAAIQRQADINNPAAPIPDPPAQPAYETTEQALAPETMDNVQSPGETPGSVQHVPAAQVDVPMAPGETMPTSPANQLVDVTAPVAGTQTGEVPLNETRIETDVRVGEDPLRASGPGIGGNGNDGTAFPWTMSAKDDQALASNRTMASLRLARLRITSGLATGDEFTIATSIETDKGLPDVALANEIRTLESLNRVAAKRERPAGLVPRAASGNRKAPSMASLPQATAGAYDADGADEDLFLSA